MSQLHQLGDLQLAIMRVLWSRGEATASEVHQALLEERGLAPTTIATMLQKMEKKGVVNHHTRGRQFVYRPQIQESEVTKSMVSDLVTRMFKGDSAALVNHLLTEGEFDADELQQLRDLVARFSKGGTSHVE